MGREGSGKEKLRTLHPGTTGISTGPLRLTHLGCWARLCFLGLLPSPRHSASGPLSTSMACTPSCTAQPEHRQPASTCRAPAIQLANNLHRISDQSTAPISIIAGVTEHEAAAHMQLGNAVRQGRPRLLRLPLFLLPWAR